MDSTNQKAIGDTANRHAKYDSVDIDSESSPTTHNAKERHVKQQLYAFYDSLTEEDRRDLFVALGYQCYRFKRDTDKLLRPPAVGPVAFIFKRRTVYLRVGSSIERATAKGQLNDLLLFALLKKAEGKSWSGLWAYAFQQRSTNYRITRMNSEIRSSVGGVTSRLGLSITQTTND
jgi:hypothetical protein